MVDTAITDCRPPATSMPTIGASAAVTLAKNFGNMRCSAAALDICASVNCQPSSEPTQATTASAMMTLPTQGVNILA